MASTAEAFLNVGHEHSGVRSGNMLRWMLAGYVICLPMQIELSEPTTIRLGISDLFLLAAAFLGMGHVRVRREAWSLWHVALLLLIPLWTIAKQPETPVVYRWVLVNKAAGILTLFLLYLLLTSLPATWDTIRWLTRLFTAS